MVGTCYGNSSNSEIFPIILKKLDTIAEDQSQKEDTRGEANNIAYKMQELEFVFMLNFRNEI